MPRARVLHLVTSALTLVSALACFGGGEDDPPTEQTKSIDGFRLEPEIVRLRPGVCSTHELVTAPGTSLKGTPLEFESAAPFEVEYEPPSSDTNKTHVSFCAGDELGEGSVNIRVEGSEAFYKAGEAFIHKLAQNDVDLVDPTWIRGPQYVPSRVFWSDDGARFYVHSREFRSLVEWDATTYTILNTYILHGEDAALLGADRAVVALPDRVGVYSLTDRVFETWFTTGNILITPAFFDRAWENIFTTGNTPLIDTAGEEIVSLGYTGFDSDVIACKHRRINLAKNERLTIEETGGTPSGALLDAGAAGDVIKTWPENRERSLQLSEDGAWALVGPRGCYVKASLIDLKTYKATTCGKDALGRAVMSSDASRIAWHEGGASISIGRGGDCEVIGEVPYGWVLNTFYAFSPDGSEFVTLGTNDAFEPAIGHKLHLVRYDASGEGEPKRIEEHVIDARFTAMNSRWMQRRHHIAYSPDGERVLFVRPDGRVGVLDISSGEVWQSTPVFWRDAVVTPKAPLVLARLEDTVSGQKLYLIDANTEELLREHEEPFQVESIHEEGYVLRHAGTLESTFFPYDLEGEPRPYDEENAPLLEWVPGQSVIDAGGASCSIGNAQGNDMVCMNEVCQDIEVITDRVTDNARQAHPLDANTCLFLDGTGALWRWNGGTALAERMSKVIGDRAGELFVLSSTQFYVRTGTHLHHWELP